MKILYFTHYGALYGANKSLLNLLEGLEEYKFGALVIIPREGDFSKALEQKQIPFLIFSFSWWCGEEKKPYGAKWRTIVANIKKRRKYQRDLLLNKTRLEVLNKQINHYNPDFVFSNSSVFNFGLLYSQRYRIPHIWCLREALEHYSFKWFYSEHYVTRSFNASDIVIAVSKFLQERYKVKHQVKNIQVLYNGVLSIKRLLRIDERRKNPSKSDHEGLIFGVVGLIHPKKGQREAIEAFHLVKKKSPNSRLLIVGEGDTRELQELVKFFELENSVEFWGHVKDPFEAFLEMDVALTCSRNEGLGRVTLEAMATALPVIGYNEGGTKELILNHKTGLLYEGSSTDLAEKMLYLVRNPDHRREMGKFARTMFEKNYTSEVYAKNFVQIIEEFRSSQLRSRI